MSDDTDCDGVLTSQDCNDSDPMTVNDMDCDGVPFTEDCNDNDPNSATTADDVNCDGLMEFSTIHAGGFHTCGVNLTDQIVCFGSDVYGETSPLLEILLNYLLGMNTIVPLIVWEISLVGAIIILDKRQLPVVLFLKFQLVYDTLVVLIIQVKSNVGEIMDMNKALL